MGGGHYPHDTLLDLPLVIQQFNLMLVSIAKVMAWYSAEKKYNQSCTFETLTIMTVSSKWESHQSFLYHYNLVITLNKSYFFKGTRKFSNFYCFICICIHIQCKLYIFSKSNESFVNQTFNSRFQTFWIKQLVL